MFGRRADVCSCSSWCSVGNPSPFWFLLCAAGPIVSSGRSKLSPRMLEAHDDDLFTAEAVFREASPSEISRTGRLDSRIAQCLNVRREEGRGGRAERIGMGTGGGKLGVKKSRLSGGPR